MSRGPALAQIAGVARPSARLLHIARSIHGPKMAACVGSMLEDAVAVNTLAGAMERALVAGTSKDGRVDMREAAIHLIREMRRNQR